MDPALTVGAIYMVGAAIAFIAFVPVWLTRRRGARIPLVDRSVLLPAPPPNLTPAMASVILNDNVDHPAFASALVDLGARGLIAFRDLPPEPGSDEARGKVQLLGIEADRTNTVQVVVADAAAERAAANQTRRTLGEPERHLLERIGRVADHSGDFDKLDGITIGARLAAPFEEELGRAAVAEGWFVTDPYATGLGWQGVGLLVAGVPAAIEALLLWGLLRRHSGIYDTFDYGGYILGILKLTGPTIVAVLIGYAIVRLSGRLPARSERGAEVLGMLTAYRQTLQHELAGSSTPFKALPGVSRVMPWIVRPDDLTVWAVALGVEPPPKGLDDALFWVASRVRSIPP